MDEFVDKIPEKNYRKIAAGFFVFLIFGILHTWLIFPPLLKAILKSQVVLKPGTQMRDMYVTLPFPLIFKFYLFHVLNPDEVMTGAKPKLQEVGPYVFEEWKTKINLVDDDVADTLEFSAVNTFIYNQTLSNGLTGDEIITVIDPLLTSMALSVNRDRAPMLPLVAKAIKEIFHDPKTVFRTVKVMDLLFNGCDVDCRSDDFNSKAICSVFEGGDVKSIWPKGDEEDMFLFAVMGGANTTEGARFKTDRGVKNLRNLGNVLEYNEEPELDVWDGQECNEFRGTESSIFPPFSNLEDGIWAFEGSICRSLKATYEKPSSYRGIPTFKYHLDLGDVAADENLHCFCSNGKCPLKGTFDLFPCTEGPLVASMPHFYNGDPALLEKIEYGLNPDKDKHAVFMHFEIISGTPMSGAKRMQFNFDLMPIPQIEIMKNLPEMVFPLMWVEEGVNLNKTFVNMLKYQLFLGLKYQATVKWLSLIMGPIGMIAALFMDYQKGHANSLQVTKILPAKEDQNNGNVDIKMPSSAVTQELNEKERY